MDILKDIKKMNREKLELDFIKMMLTKIQVEQENIELHRSIRTLKRHAKRASCKDREEVVEDALD